MTTEKFELISEAARQHSVETTLEMPSLAKQILEQLKKSLHWAARFEKPATYPEMAEVPEETDVKLDMRRAVILYKGYVDDPRNTDNAWMETTVAHLHLTPEEAVLLNPKAGDDAVSVEWFPLTEENRANLYASHRYFAELALVNIKNNYG